MRALVLVMFVTACGTTPAKDLTIAATFTVRAVTGTNPSPLDPLVDQSVELSITLAQPELGNDGANGCQDTTIYSNHPVSVASGATADVAQHEILDILPDYTAKLELCMPRTASSAALQSDNLAGFALTFGCPTLPDSAFVTDGHGNPQWTTMEIAGCDVQLYDELHARLFMGSETVVRFEK